MVAQSQCYIGRHVQRPIRGPVRGPIRGPIQAYKNQHFHSFARVDVQPHSPQKFAVHPFVVVRNRDGWHTKALAPLATSPGMQNLCAVAGTR
ncbi:MAG: hypothetical protein HC800_15075 [Phormidesmis sp. RL_2_1]|nr:hypothetical protein [Phormidesmis sp. RL_2_1]